MFRWPWQDRNEVCGSGFPLPLPPSPPPHPEQANIDTARELIARGASPDEVAAWLARQCPGAFQDATHALETLLAVHAPA